MGGGGPPTRSAPACTASSSDREVMTTSAPSTASAIVPASRAPAARTSSAWPFERFHTTTEWPPPSGRRARACPIRPIPSTAISMRTLLPRRGPLQPDGSVEIVELEKLGDGVWAWLQPGGGSGISNAGVVADDDGLTVIDCLMVRSQWEPFAAAVAEIGQPVRRLVLTHAHLDHGGGTQAFPLPLIPATPAPRAP